MQTESKYLAADLLQVLIARHYEPRYGNSFVCIGNFPGYDIKFSSGQTAEVKCDRSAVETGNACIEYWFKNRASGILATSASFWLHIVPEGSKFVCYEMDTKRLLRLCLETGRVKAGGDSGLSLFKLIPLERIKEISSQVFVLDHELTSNHTRQ